MKNSSRYAMLSLLIITALSGCSSHSDKKPPLSDENFELEILHVNDLHSYTDPVSIGINTPKGMIKVDVGGAEALKSVVEERKRQNPDLIVISAGDQITGNALNYDTFHGESDAVLHGLLHTDYYMLGNHEFDHGGDGIETFMNFMKHYSPQSLMINSDMTAAPDSKVTDRGLSSHIRKVSGKNVAFYAVTNESKIVRSSSPEEGMSFKKTVPTINELTSENADRADIHILITHQGITSDKTNASLLNDVDIIIGGDSHTLCGNFSDKGISVDCPYPITATNASGHKICIVQAYEYGKVIGDLKVTFDGHGNVLQCGGTPVMPLWTDTAEPHKNSTLSKEEAVEEAGRLPNLPESPYISASKNNEATATLKSYRDVLETRKKVIGRSPRDFCNTRYPYAYCNIKGKSNPYGSETCQTLGKVILENTGADIYLVNSGMYRTDISKGDFTEEDLLNVTPFGNDVVEITMSGKDIYEVLNDTMEFVNEDLQSRSGGVPCGYGFSYSLRGKGKNPVSDISILTREGREESLDMNRNYRVLVTTYILKGKDGYSLLKGKKPLKNIGSDADIIRSYLRDHALPDIPENIRTIRSFSAE